MTFPWCVGGEGSATKTGLGKLILSGDNTYTGSSNVNAGELEVSGSLNDSSALNVNSSGRYVVSKNDTIGSISGGGEVILNSSQLTVGADNTTSTFSGILSGSGGLTKIGSGTLTLSGDNTFTGTTLVESGTLNVLGSSPVSAQCASGATSNICVADSSPSPETEPTPEPTPTDTGRHGRTNERTKRNQRNNDTDDNETTNETTKQRRNNGRNNGRHGRHGRHETTNRRRNRRRNRHRSRHLNLPPPRLFLRTSLKMTMSRKWQERFRLLTPRPLLLRLTTIGGLTGPTDASAPQPVRGSAGSDPAVSNPGAGSDGGSVDDTVESVASRRWLFDICQVMGCQLICR